MVDAESTRNQSAATLAVTDSVMVSAEKEDSRQRHRAEEALLHSEERWRLIYEAEPECVKIISPEGRLEDMNPAGLSMVEANSLDEIRGELVLDLIAPEYREAYLAMHREVIGGHSGQLIYEMIGLKGTRRLLETHAVPLRNADGSVSHLGISHDITARKQAEAAVRKSEAMLELVLDSIPQGVFWKDRHSVYLGANRVARQAMGIDAPQGILGTTDFGVANFSHDQAEYFVQKDREVMQSGQPQFGIVETMSLADGSKLWLETNKLPIRDHAGNITGVLGTWQDITERKRADEELKASHERLETLSRQLIEAQESERRHLARELHDEIGQALTGIKLNLKALQQPLPTMRASDLVKDTLEVVDQTLQQVRNLALDLRPSMLDDIGLVAALRWCLDRQSQRAGFVPCFSADSYVRSASPEIETACFRIVQESLTNIARHANARNVSVELRQHDSELELLVQDDGIGFDVPAARIRAAHGASIGLLGMQERVQLVGGQIEIESSPSQGTTVRARIRLASL